VGYVVSLIRDSTDIAIDAAGPRAVAVAGVRRDPADETFEVLMTFSRRSLFGVLCSSGTATPPKPPPAVNADPLDPV